MTRPARSRTTGLVLIAAVAALVLAGAAAWAGLSPGSPTPAAHLEGASAPGPAPFVQAIGRDRDDMIPPAGSGGPRSGDTAGLYAKAVDSCTTAAVADAIAASGRGQEWAEAFGVASADAPAALAALTPVILRGDVIVTEHGLSSSGPTTYSAILQAGSAVLVDDRGMPRVRCANGNPISAPEHEPTSDVVGTPWPYLSPTLVTTVVPADAPVTELTVLDLDSDNLVDIPAGQR